MQAHEIRRAFLSFFEDRDHAVVPSSPLIPHDDPTLFFVNAGMVQFKDIFTGRQAPPGPRVASVQKCLRVSGKHNDLDNVGRTPRHHTFFEMLGNFSFGDYFKAEAIPMAWALLTEDLCIDADRLWVTVYEDDDESYEIWRSKVGIPEARLQRLGAKDNFWSMGDVGPCGPCSEIHYDHGPGISDDERGPAGEDDRYVEIWNLVFMQYEQLASGERIALPNPSIDTGAGLERIAAVKQGVYSNYGTDLFQPLIRRAAELAGVQYGSGGEVDTALQVIADHSRATAFLVGDGVMPSNEGRGYVLRRVMRRAIRFGVKLGIDAAFLHETVAQVIADFGDVYPELSDRASFVHQVVLGEEQRFRRTLDRGMKLLDGELTKAKASDTGSRVLPGQVAFTLSDTYGFPLDLTQLIAAEHDVAVDEAEFQAHLEDQRQRGRAAWKGSGEVASTELWTELAKEVGDTDFTGFTFDVGVGNVVAIVRWSDVEGEGKSQRVERLDPGERGVVILDRTPFYAEAGGQVGDTGQIGSLRVDDTTVAAGLVLHSGEVGSEPISVGDAVRTQVDAERRDRTRKNHTGTHLLHAALREVLGTHVTQKGSLVAPDRLRFDFSHHAPMTAKEIDAVEDMVNVEILKNTAVDTTVEDMEAAVGRGAMALFGEKYDDQVRVVAVPGFSVELCGGTHCARTGDIGSLRITAESGIAAGVRRIEAQTGMGALRVGREDARRIAAVAQQLKTNVATVPEAVARMQKERKDLEKQLAAQRTEAARASAGALLSQAREFDGVKVLAAEFDGDLREQADRLRDQLGPSVVVLAARRGPKVQLLAAATKDVAGKRIHAGNIVKEIAPLIGGGGGGRPDMAQAGGKKPDGIPAALDRAYEYAAEVLGA